MLPILDVDRVRKTFGPIRAVQDLSLRVEPGELVARVGPNGAGKTTHLRRSSGCSGRTGAVWCTGLVLSDRADPRRIGYLPEEHGLYTDVPVRQVLL